jgi:pimeloyl-ACP methyl ester carboxylesterase
VSDRREVISVDGTRIAVRASGEGEAVLLVHGSGTTGADWFAVAPILRRRFRVVTMDRRGRGASGDGAEYSIEREAEDVLAVLEAEECGLVVAHSYGGLCAVLAAARSDRIRRMALYEPPFAYDGQGFERFEESVERGDYDDALYEFLGVVGMAPEHRETIRRSAAWPLLREVTPTLPRELRAAQEWRIPSAPIIVPTLYLLGAETRGVVYLDGLDELLSRFTDVRRAEIAGQQHVAHVFAAGAFAEPTEAFLAER